MVEVARDIRKPKAFKNVSLQMMIDQTFTFRRMLFKKLHHIQVLTFDVNVQSGRGSGTLLPLSASASASTSLS